MSVKVLSMKMLSLKVFSWMSDSDYSAAIDTDTHSVINHYAKLMLQIMATTIDREIKYFFKFLSFIIATKISSH